MLRKHCPTCAELAKEMTVIQPSVAGLGTRPQFAKVVNQAQDSCSGLPGSR